MQKILAISINPEKHKDINEIVSEIRSLDLGFSRVVRRLLREHRDRGYRFPDKSEPVI